MILQRHFKNWLVAVCCLLFAGTVLAQPANDLCADAEVITEGVTNGTTVDATNSFTTTCGTANTAPEVFYSFTPTTSGVGVFSLCGSSYDTKISVFTGTCGALTCVGGNDDFCGLQSQVIANVVAGTTFTIVVHGFAANTGTFTLDVSVVPPPANDLCADAITLVPGTNVSGNTLSATTTGAVACDNAGDGTGGGIWYTFMGNGEMATVSTDNAGTGFDTQLAVYDGTCDALNCIDGDDDGGTGLTSTVFFTTEGVQYFVYVDGFGTARGSFELSLELPDPPLPPGALEVDLAAITRVNRTLNEDCEAMLTPRQVLVGNWDVDGDGNEPGNEDFRLVVEDGNTCNGPIIDGCGTYIYTVTGGQSPAITLNGFNESIDGVGCSPIETFTNVPNPATQTASVEVTADTVFLRTMGGNVFTDPLEAGFSYTFPAAGNFNFFATFETENLPFDGFIISFDGAINPLNLDIDFFTVPLPGIPLTADPNGFSVEAGDRLVLILREDDGFTFDDNADPLIRIFNFVYNIDAIESSILGFTTAWGYVNAEDKTSPVFTVEPTAPAPLFCNSIELIDVNELASDISRCWTVEAKTGATIAGTMSPLLFLRLEDGGGVPMVIDGCSDVEICVNDVPTRTGDACDDVIITRTFTARDGLTCGAVSGEENAPTVFSYDIIFTSPTLADVVGVPVEDIVPTCVDVADGGINPQPASTDYPFILVDGAQVHLDGAFCNLGVAFEDSERIITCENAYKFVRTYTVIDWCDVTNTRTFSQTVKVGDFEAPNLEAIELDSDFDGEGDGLPLVYTTNSNDCSAFINFFAQVDVVDNCDATPTLSAFVFPGGDLNGAPLGPFFPGTLAGGFPVGDHTVRFVAVDNCGNEDALDVPFRVLDMTAPVAICEDGLNISIQSNGEAQLCAEDIDRASYDDCSDITLHIAKVNNNNAPIGGVNAWTDCLDITCADLGTLRVGLRVTDTSGISNFCWLDVLIEDKINPICIAPIPVTVVCDELAGTFPANVQTAFSDDPAGTTALLNDLFGAATGVDNCDSTTITQTVSDQRNDCGLGRIVRTFRVRDLQNLLSTNNCTQEITVLGNHNYSILLPADTDAVCMDATYNDVTFDENGCDLITVSTSIDTFQASADECYKLRITYEILNWCEWNGEDDGYLIPRAEVDVNEPTWLHIVPDLRNTLTDDLAFLDRDSDPENGAPSFITNLDTGDGGIVEGTDPEGYGLDRSRGSFIYRQFVKVYDDIAPVITVNTPNGPFCDLDGDCVANADLTFTVTDDCNGASVSARAFLDAFRDAGDGGVYTLADFPATQDATDVSSEIGRLPDGTFTLNLENLPFGEHAVRISATDGCGNTSVDLLLFEIADCKAPTPICINGLTVTLMPDGNGGGMADIWASDFIASPSADCSGEVQFSLYGPDDYNAPGFAPAVGDTGLIVTCDDMDMVIVRVYAIDPAGLSDYCETTLFVQAFQPSVCTSGSGNLAGAITTPNAQGMDNVEVNIAGGTGAEMAMTQNGGFYTFNSLQEGADYTVQPAYDPAVNLATVSTADLIMISRHILGLQTLAGQYQLLAADVTQDANVNVLDIIAIRRVILGIDASFSQTASWKFYHDGNAEVFNVNNLVGSITNADFVAVEMGNVSDAIAGAQTATGRGLETIKVEDIEVVAGNTYAVAFDAANLAGFQATIELAAGLELVSVDYASEQATGFNLAQAAEGLIAVSHMGEGAFTLELRATTDGQLSELLKLSNRITTSEAYPTNGGVANLNLNFTAASVGADFVLEQNTPNPFADVTKIGFNLPIASEVTLSVQDIQGRTILARQLEGVAGYNTANINVAELKGATGVMTYTIVAGDFTATRKMVVVR